MIKKYFAFLFLFCLSAFVYAQSTEDTLVDRLKEYAKNYTCSNDNSESFPSTDTQKVLATLLAEELISFGIPERDVEIDDNFYVYATIKGNIKDAPTIFLSAHLDTTPDAKFNTKAPNVKVHEYNGGDLVINEKLGLILTEEKNEFLTEAIGGKVITSDGETLLGGDDKAGMAIVMTLAETFAKNPDIPHGDIRILFTPDEEIGRSTMYLTKEKIAADFGLVLDSHGFGRLLVGNFNATDYSIAIKTPPAGHPGYSSKVPALRIANNFASRMPDRLAAYRSRGNKGYMDYNDLVEGEVVPGRLRSFTTSELNRYKNKLRRKARRTARRYHMNYIEIDNGEIVRGEGLDAPSLTLTMKDSYFNAKYVLEKYPTNFALLQESFNKVGVKMIPQSGRGGSDAGDITYLGIPTYNMFTGSHNEHSRDEWVSSKQMLASYNVALEYIKLIGQQDRLSMLREGNPKYTPAVPTLNMKHIERVQQKILEKYGNSFSNF